MVGVTSGDSRARYFQLPHLSPGNPAPCCEEAGPEHWRQRDHMENRGPPPRARPMASCENEALSDIPAPAMLSTDYSHMNDPSQHTAEQKCVVPAEP